MKEISWTNKAEILIPPLPWDKPVWRQRDGDTVVLLHGLWRGKRAMDPLARYLSARGFSTLNLPYPSSRLPVDSLLPLIRREIEKVATDRPVHFVTHSLGGILARLLIHESPAFTAGKLVMLAPPSTGSEIVDYLCLRRWSSAWLGPAGRVLGCDGLPARLPTLPENLDAAVIMGRRSSLPLFRKLLEEDNDGIVSVSRGRIPGLRGFCVVDADHTFIPLHREVWDRCALFLENGTWPEPSSEAGGATFSDTAHPAAF